jgi:membrane-associated phospholipid phosphatase
MTTTVLLLLLLLPARVSAQSESRFARWAYQDAFGLVTAVGRNTATFVASGIPIASSIMIVDRPVRHQVQVAYGEQSGIATFLDVTNHLGGSRMKYPVAALFVVSLASDDSKFQDAAFTSLQSLAYAGGITAGLKAVAGRSRPEDLGGAYRFNPFGGDHSFPSGHTTAAFAILTPWVLYYPSKATYGLFALASGTAVARIALDKHWPSDVIAGGLIGFTTARFLTRRHLGSSRSFRVTPSVLPDAVSMTVTVNLN